MKALLGKTIMNLYDTNRQVYKGEQYNSTTGERKLVALKKLNMINEKDGVMN